MVENLYNPLKGYGNNMKMVGNLLKLYGNTWLGEDWGQPQPGYIEICQLIFETEAEEWKS